MSDNIEVIEIGVPAEHVTTIDHSMELPNTTVNPEREFRGQKFVHNKVEEATWNGFRIPFSRPRYHDCKEYKNVAGVQVIQPDKHIAKESWYSADILFNFVMEGTMTLCGEGKDFDLQS